MKREQGPQGCMKADPRPDRSSTSATATRHLVFSGHVTNLPDSDWLRSAVTFDCDNALVITPLISALH